MAESTLTLTWDDLKEEVGFFLGYGSDSTAWSTSQETEIERIVQTGYRRVLYPFAVQGVVGHKWSFLHPSATLDTVDEDYDYDLPDDFGGMNGDFHYDADECRTSIRRIPLATLLDMRSTNDYDGYPNFFAIRFKSSDGTTGQRQEALFYPTPDAVYTLHYAYNAYQGVLSDEAPYPLGGMQMSEVYKESCLAAAEARNDDAPGVHTQQFERLLIDAVARDRDRGPVNYGRMGQPPEYGEERFKRGNELYGGAYRITYGGEYI